MALLDDVKTALRITIDDFDGEIQDLIDACKTDLEQAGLYVIDEEDVLIKRAIILYCKANFGYDNPEADRFQESYEMLVNHLSMSSDYAYYKITFEVGEQVEVNLGGEVKETDENGQVNFFSREKNHVPYRIGDIEEGYIDIKEDTSITVGG